MRLLLILKAALFSVFLVLGSANWSWLAIFIIAALYFYFRESWNRSRFFSSFVILLSSSVLSVWRLAGQSSPLLFAAAVIFGILFFILLGVKNFIFVHRLLPYYFLSSFLLLAVFLLFFSVDKSNLLTAEYLLVGLSAFLLYREFLLFNSESSPSLLQTPLITRKNLIAFALAFLTFQLVWVVSLLPLGFLNSASLLLLFALLFEDLLLHNWNGTLTRQIILRNMTFLLLIGLVIFAFSKWTP